MPARSSAASSKTGTQQEWNNNSDGDSVLSIIRIPVQHADTWSAQSAMARYVIGPDVALYLAKARATISGNQKLLAPTLLRSEVLALLYESVRRGDVDHKEAREQLDYLRSLKLRLLGDRVLQRVAWEIAEQLDWPDTFRAEYLALTRLQADAFVTLDRKLARKVRVAVRVGTISDII